MNPRAVAFLLSLINLPLGLAYAGYPLAAAGVVVGVPAIVSVVPSIIYYYGWISGTIFLGWYSVGVLVAWLSPIAVAALPRKTPAKAISTAVYVTLFIASWLLALSTTVVLRNQVIELYNVPSGSMAPTFQIGDHFIARKHQVPFAGDIVVYRDPRNRGVILVTRIVAVGGQTVEIEANRPIIDGEPVPWESMGTQEMTDHSCETSTMNAFVETVGQRSYTVIVNPGLSGPLADMEVITVPDDSVFVLADNRDNSEDSRAYGPIPVADILGVSDGEVPIRDSWLFDPCSP